MSATPSGAWPVASKRVWPVEKRPRGAYWRDHARVLRSTLSHLSRRFATTLWVWVMIGIALALPAALYLLESNLVRIAGQWRENPGFSVYFAPGVSMDQPRALVGRLASLAEIDGVWLTTPEDALVEFRGLTGVGEALALLDDNPLPASVRATVTADVAEYVGLAVQTGHSQPGVEQRDLLGRVGEGP